MEKKIAFVYVCVCLRERECVVCMKRVFSTLVLNLRLKANAGMNLGTQAGLCGLLIY